jgi:hypothetical protein
MHLGPLKRFWFGNHYLDYNATEGETMQRCERCGVELSVADFVPCKDIPDCPLLASFDRALERALNKQPKMPEERFSADQLRSFRNADAGPWEPVAE